MRKKVDPARWQRVQEIFLAALEREPAERGPFVQDICAADQELEEEVLALLRADEEGDALLAEGGLERVAAAVMDAGMPHLEQVGPYRIVRELGRGGMGVVYLGEREDLDARVAIKVLRDAGLSPARLERFLREQRVLSQLHHPDIARLYDAGRLPDGTPYIVMEHAPGRPVTELCVEENLTLEVRLGLFRRACEAVGFAHREAIVHRDLKPSNIFASLDGPTGQPKVTLLDFGIAKELGTLAEDETATMLRMLTPAYAAPEQIRGEGAGLYTDVYALGVLLYEMLSATRPFDLETLTPGQAEALLEESEPEKPSRRAEGREGAARASQREWADLDVICAKAMHKEVARRYPSVEALVRDLDRFLSGQPLEARPDELGYRVGKFLRRHRRALAVAGVVLAGIVSLSAFYTYRLAQARDAALAEAARTQRVQDFMLGLFGDERAGPQEGLTVRELVDRGAREASLLDRDPAIQAELFEMLGSISTELGRFDAAEFQLGRSLEIRRRVFGDEHPETARSLSRLAHLRGREENTLEEAERLARQALAIDRDASVKNDPRVAESLAILGSVLIQQGRYEEAVDVLGEAVVIDEARGETPRLSSSLGGLAEALAYLGQHDRAVEINLRLLGIDESLFGSGHPAYAADLLNLAWSREELGESEEAERLAREALEIHREYYGDAHFQTASNLSVLGRILVEQRRFEEAQRVLSEALAINEEVLGPDHRAVGLTLAHLSQIALIEGDLERGRELLERQLRIFEGSFEGDHAWIATVYSNLAVIDFKEGDYAASAEKMRAAISIQEEMLPPGHVDTAIARVKLGQVLLEEQRYAEAEAALRRGHDVLEIKLPADSAWTAQARRDLVTIYEALDRHDEAEAMRGKLRSVAESSTDAS